MDNLCVIEIIDYHDNVNESVNGSTPLHILTKAKDLLGVLWLLANGTKGNARDRNFNSAAVYKKNINVMQCLIVHNAHLNPRNYKFAID